MDTVITKEQLLYKGYNINQETDDGITLNKNIEIDNSKLDIDFYFLLSDKHTYLVILVDGDGGERGVRPGHADRGSHPMYHCVVMGDEYVHKKSTRKIRADGERMAGTPIRIRR